MTPWDEWLQHVEKWRDCQRCPLAQQRDRIVLGRGTLPCDVLFIGEAPGASEDALGLPFEGPAGRLLDQIIERALPRGVTYAMTNLVCCFPREAKGRGDNEPEYSEIVACRPRLAEFVRICRPKLVVCVGSLAAGHAERVHGVKFTDIVHPAHVLAHMPLAQKNQAVNRAIVVIRNAVESVLQPNQTQEITDAIISPPVSDDDIPF